MVLVDREGDIVVAMATMDKRTRRLRRLLVSPRSKKKEEEASSSHVFACVKGKKGEKSRSSSFDVLEL